MEKQWIKLGRVSSTNLFISKLLAQGEMGESLVVVADYQEDGRGQGSHSWHSREGENLLMSLLLFPAFLSASDQFHLSRLASLAICDTLDSLGVGAVIKWPNDILTAKGKISGILIEHGISGKKIKHTIVGIGLNLNQTEFPEFPVPASSVKLETGLNVDVQAVARALQLNLRDRYKDLEKGQVPILEKDYLDKLHLINQAATYQSGKESFQGIIRGVDKYGELVVEKDGKLLSYAHGNIQLVSG